jgi:hypothetical protein
LYSYPSASRGELDDLRPSEPASAALSPIVRRGLIEAGILRSRSDMLERARVQAQETAAARRVLQDERYVVLPHALAPLQLAAVRRYYRAVIAEGFLPFGDDEWPDRYFASRDPIALFFHQHMTDLVGEVAGERVKPSFSFFASYHRGGILPPHRDREQCEYSVSVLIDHAPEPADLSPWPLYLRAPGAEEAVSVSLGLGDAVVYRGRELWHSRGALTAVDFCSYWFFFYVPETFTGPLD